MADFLEFSWAPDPLVYARELDVLANEVSDFTAPLEDSIPLVISAMRRIINEENYGSWPYWSDSYAKRALKFPNIGILRRTDENIYNPLDEPDNFDVTENELVFTGFGMPNSIWEWHNSGLPDRTTASGAPNPLPQREFVGLDDTGETGIMRVFATWLDQLLASWGYTKMPTGQFRTPGGQFGPKFTL